MMPCVAKEASDLSPSAAGPPDRPKNIYKPKYHAFSIDSLVGNNDHKNSDRDSNSSENKLNEKTSSRGGSPLPRRPLITPTPPLNGHKDINDNSNNSLRSYENSDENGARLMAKDEGILRSYMTTPNQSAGPHTDTPVDASHNNSHYISSLSHNSDDSILNHPISHRFVESIPNSSPKYDHILSLRSNLSESGNGSPERLAFGSPSLQTSPFNSSQYYCNQMYCRPFDDRVERIIQNNPYLPQICGKS